MMPPQVPDIAPVVNLQVARTCNLRCSFCSHDVWEKPTGLMDYALFERVIESLKQDGCTTVCFVSAQGESLLHPRIFDMLQASLDAGFETNLCTNGTPLTPKRIAKLAALNLHAIQFSFSGWDQESYERLYVGGKFDRVSENLRQLIRALRGTRTSLTVNGVMDDSDGFGRTFEYLMALGAQPNKIHLQVPHNWGGTVNNGFRPPNAPAKVCPLLVSTPGIYIDGRVTACGCIDANGALEIGDIKDEPLSAMRKGSRYQSLLNAFVTRDVSKVPLCGRCEIPYQ